MAKTLTTKKPAMAGLSELNKIISKRMDNKSENFKFFEERGVTEECIQMGNYLLNAQISGSLFGGMNAAKSMMLAGDSGTGKSYLCLNMAKSMKDHGYHIYYIDTEGAMSYDMFENFDLSVSQEDNDDCDVTLIKAIKSYSEVKFLINAITDGVKKLRADEIETKVAIILDSVGMMNTDSEVENANKGKDAEDMGKRAKQIRALFRTITLDLHNLCIPFVFTNHTSANLDMFAIEKEVTAGGKGAVYSAHYILMLALRNFIKDDSTKDKKGVILKSRPKKNRTAVPKDVEFYLSWKEGMNPYVGLEQYYGWDNCHVDLGTIYTKEEFTKKFPKGVTDSKLRIDEWTDKDGDWVAVINHEMIRSKTIAIKATHKTVPFDKFYSGEVWDEASLRELDENVIKKEFQYAKAKETADEIFAMFDESASDSDDK